MCVLTELAPIKNEHKQASTREKMTLSDILLFYLRKNFLSGGYPVKFIGQRLTFGIISKGFSEE